MRRELRAVRNDAVLGAVVVDEDGTRRFEGGAAEVLQGLRRQLGVADDAKLVDHVMEHGWSNGALYFYPVPPAEPLD